MKTAIKLTIGFIEYLFYLSAFITVSVFSVYLYGQVLEILIEQQVSEFSYRVASICMAFAIIGGITKMCMWYLGINKDSWDKIIGKIRGKNSS